LLELDNRLRILRPQMSVLDVGAAPGGWSQVAAEKVKKGSIVAVDLMNMDPVPQPHSLWKLD